MESSLSLTRIKREIQPTLDLDIIFKPFKKLSVNYKPLSLADHFSFSINDFQGRIVVQGKSFFRKVFYGFSDEIFFQISEIGIVQMGQKEKIDEIKTNHIFDRVHILFIYCLEDPDIQPFVGNHAPRAHTNVNF